MNSSSGITSTVKGAMKGIAANGTALAQIIKLPSNLQNNSQAVRLEGQVIAQNKSDNSVTIRTSSGDIQAKIKTNRQPAIGQNVEIEIPAGRANTARNDIRAAQVILQPSQPPSTQTTSTTTPTQTVTNSVTVSNTAATQVTTTSATAQPSQAQPSQAQPPNLNNAPLLSATVQDAITPARAQNIQAQIPQILDSQTTFRLISVPPATANNIASTFLQTLPTPQNSLITNNSLLPTNIALPTNISVPTTAQPNIVIPNNITPNTQIIFSSINTNTTAQNIPTQNSQSSNLTAPLATTLPTQTNTPSQILQPAQFAPPQTIQQTLGQTITAPNALSTSLIPTSVQPQATLITNSAQLTAPQSSSRIGQIDVQILNTNPAEIAITPTNNNAPSARTVLALTQFPTLTTGGNNAGSLSAQVTGFTANNLPLITVQGVGGGQLTQSFILQAPNTNLQYGQKIQLIPQGTNTAPINNAASALRAPLSNPLLMGFQWPAMDELFQTLQNINPQLASSLAKTLPNAASANQLGPAAMVVIAAIRSGNFNMLMNDKKMDALQQMGKAGLLDSLTQSTARAGAGEPAAATQSDWRAVPLPMFWENEIHRITLYTRQESDENEKQQNGQNGTRFVMDLSLSRMGDVQIDGLVKDNRLDLILRTEHHFSAPMQQTMRQAYSGALAYTDLVGELNFQGETDKWIHVLEREAQLGVNI